MTLHISTAFPGKPVLPLFKVCSMSPLKSSLLLCPHPTLLSQPLQTQDLLGWAACCDGSIADVLHAILLHVASVADTNHGPKSASSCMSSTGYSLTLARVAVQTAGLICHALECEAYEHEQRCAFRAVCQLGSQMDELCQLLRKKG